MQLLDILTKDRVFVSERKNPRIRDKAAALKQLAELLVTGDPKLDLKAVEECLKKREELQSTGVGGGVAIPHAKIEGIDHIVGALLLCNPPIGYDAIDGAPVSILFAVVGPMKSPGEHIKVLARVSRLLRDDGFRARLVESETSDSAYALIEKEEGRSHP